MPALVHLTDGKDAERIRACGLHGLPACFPGARLTDKVQLAQAVFAMPLLPNESATHQWMTELLGRGYKTIVAVHFEVDRHTKVWVGRERHEHLCLPVCDAVDRMHKASDLRGWEIIIPGDVPSAAIIDLRQVPCRVVPTKAELHPCDPGERGSSHAPERLSPSVDPRLPI
ncbi:MAG TPA: hypothetical protein VD997_02250 [Phycisphaerales bacterium]|nr:hypothetical protein [Phycisphaerales bacterium]